MQNLKILFKDKILKNPLIKTGLLYIVTDSVNRAIPFLLLPIIAKFLSPSEYGIVANFTILVAIMMVFIGVSMEGAISANFYKLRKLELSKYITGTLLITFLSFFILAIVVFFSRGTIFIYTKIPFRYQIFALILSYFQVITQINLTLWRLETKALKFGIYQILQTLINFGLSIYFIAMLNYGWKGRADGFSIAATLFGILSLIILFKRGYLRLNISKALLKDALLFGLPLLPHSLSMWIRSGIDRVFITKYIGEAANGLFSTGFQFGILMTFITVAFNNTFIPFLYKKLSSEDDDELASTKYKLVRMSYFIMIGLVILSIILVAISFFLIKYFLPVSYAFASKFVFWAILAQTFQGMYFLVGNYIFFAKKTKIFSIITFSCSLLQVVLSYFLITRIGIMGAAYSSTIISFVNFVAIWYYSNKVYPMPWLKLNSKSSL